MTVCLAMIVRNESAVIERCLSAVKPYIDAYAIVDTGSTDDTIAKIRAVMAQEPAIQGSVESLAWKGMSASRNDALALARGSSCDYILMLDADDVWTPDEGFRWPDSLTADAYNVELRQGDACSWSRPALMRSDAPWEYQGAFHECIVGGARVPFEQRILDAHIRSMPDGHRRTTEGQAKYDRIAKLGEAAVAKNPHDTRAMFYLAQSYRDADRPGKALVWYTRRAECGGFAEEVWFSLYQVASIKAQLGFPGDKVLTAFQTAYEERPSRLETLVQAAAYCRQTGRPHLAFMYANTALTIRPTADLLFVDPGAERRAMDELAIAALRTGRLDVALQTNSDLLRRDDLPALFRTRIEGNLDAAVAASRRLLKAV